MDDFEELKENYWKTVARTRSSGRIAPGVIQKAEESWERFDADVIREALRIHIDRYPGYKETYTVGIMRNLQKQKASGNSRRTGKNSFTRMEQSSGYGDMDELEKQLLAN